jgi:hypothetical protein
MFIEVLAVRRLGSTVASSPSLSGAVAMMKLPIGT